MDDIKTTLKDIQPRATTQIAQEYLSKAPGCQARIILIAMGSASVAAASYLAMAGA